MNDKDKLIHQLFVGKVTEILGFEKTVQLLKESKEAFNHSVSIRLNEENILTQLNKTRDVKKIN